MLLFVFTISVAQEEDWGCSKPNKKAKKEFDKAYQLHFKGSASYKFLIDAVNIDPEFVEALSALAYINSQRDQNNVEFKNRAISYYEKTRNACAAYRNYEASFYLAKVYYEQKKYDACESMLQEYIANAKTIRGNKIQEAKELKEQIDQYQKLFENKMPFNPKKVEGASTSFDEYLPMLSPDNQYLFFTRKAEVDSRSVMGTQEKELFIQSRRQYNGKYSEGIPMPTPFNQGAYQGGASISIDNRLLFITIVDQVVTRDGRGFSNGDIYYSEFEGGKWGMLKSIGDHINGRFTWEGQPSISADNKTLYFASARGEDNFGGMDLYKTERQTDGSWGPPINLGPKINTKGNEKSPFMHSDSYTLYFSSDGHPGVGGQDIFFARTNKFGTFEAPVNLGVPINTEEDEHGFMVSTDGHYGYFSSNMGEKGLDIFYFELPEEFRPKEIVFLKGSIASKDPNAAKGMSIELKNTTTNEVVQGVVDEENGEYVAVISATEEQDVMMMAKKNGYAFTSQYIKSKKDVVGKPMRTEPVAFNPIEEGETYEINNINFETDSYELNEQVINILSEFIVFLQENPSIKIAINGHTDNVGDPKSNLDLSTNRANAVKNFLILEGISPARLSAKGYGESSPISSNSTAEGRAKNRRTEFVILSK
ncbi:MAG: OmpA family protein [Bacteroidetes bacterium]|nr:OmpA family protein [Flavobacteriales bacterium]NOG56911.1 OmpA family protein [Bacteroidota bacterium]